MSHGSRKSAAAVFSAPFVVCVLVLAGAAVGKEILVRWAGGAMRKEPIPLRKPLHALDRSKLGDYQVVKAEAISSSMEQALGTKEYLSWVLEDTSVKSKTSPARFAHVMVTYYTGTQDPVPHTAEVCFLGAGYSPKQAHDTHKFTVPELGEVPLRVCTFVKTAIFNKEEPTVVYTFHANGKFAADRQTVRLTTTNLFNRHAYFSKVEVSFGGVQCQPRNLGRQESVEAAAKFMNMFLPILVQEHWPDWQAVENPEPRAISGGA